LQELEQLLIRHTSKTKNIKTINRLIYIDR